MALSSSLACRSSDRAADVVARVANATTAIHGLRLLPRLVFKSHIDFLPLVRFSAATIAVSITAADVRPLGRSALNVFDAPSSPPSSKEQPCNYPMRGDDRPEKRPSHVLPKPSIGEIERNGHPVGQHAER